MMAEDYVTVNPQKEIPTLVVGEQSISQSAAILEYLEETHPGTTRRFSMCQWWLIRERNLCVRVCAQNRLCCPRTRMFALKSARYVRGLSFPSLEEACRVAIADAEVSTSVGSCVVHSH